LALTEYSGTLEPKTTLGISAIARIIEPKAHGYLGSRAGGNTPELQALFETGRLPSCSGVVDAMDDSKRLTPHASRVNGTVPVATISWRFTYLCWNIPFFSLSATCRSPGLSLSAFLYFSS